MYYHRWRIEQVNTLGPVLLVKMENSFTGEYGGDDDGARPDRAFRLSGATVMKLPFVRTLFLSEEFNPLHAIFLH